MNRANRPIPQDLDMEMALLGCCLIYESAFDTMTRHITREMADVFYVPKHRQLFAAIHLIRESARDPCDEHILCETLKAQGWFDEVGGLPYLVECVNRSASDQSDYYALALKQKWMLRRLITAADEITANCFAPTAASDAEATAAVIEKSERLILDITEQRVAEKEKPIAQLADEVLHRATHTMEDGIETGYGRLDDLTGGLQRGQLIVIAARPSIGKTALVVSMLDFIGVTCETPSLLFSLEMSDLEIVQRFAAVHARVDLKRLRTGKLTGLDVEMLTKGLDDIKAGRVFINAAYDLTISELRARARLYCRRHAIQVIAVDYLQQLHAPSAAKNDNRQAEVAAVSKGLKAMARELDVCVIALSQLNRASEAEQRDPRLSDLRESGAIEQDADVVMLLHRKSREESETKLIVAKQRNGPIGAAHLHFHHLSTRFDTAAPFDDDSQASDEATQAVLEFSAAKTDERPPF